MFRYVVLRTLLLIGLSTLIGAFHVRQRQPFTKVFTTCLKGSRARRTIHHFEWEKTIRLRESTNDFDKDKVSSLFIESTTAVQPVNVNPEEQYMQNQGRIYKTYQELVSYIMKTPLWRDYSLSLTMKPIITKSISSMIGFFVGDILAQLILRKGSFNFARLLRMGAFGSLVHGPSGHLFYGFLERKFPGASTAAVVKKVTVDQLLWCPIFTAALFCFTGITAGFSPREIFAIFKISGPQVILSSWLIWPAAHAVNFRVIPGRQRLLYINVIQLFFNSILSALANNVV